MKTANKVLITGPELYTNLKEGQYFAQFEENTFDWFREKFGDKVIQIIIDDEELDDFKNVSYPEFAILAKEAINKVLELKNAA